MNLKHKLTSLERKFKKRKMKDDFEIIETGVCTFDENGIINHSQARKIKVPKNQCSGFGILLLPKPISKEQWQQLAEKQQAKILFKNKV